MVRLRKAAVFFILLLLVACSNKRGQLKPLNLGGENELLISGQPQLVTFSELQTDPEAYQNKMIRVTGNFITLPSPTCYPYSGPGAEWALISEGLRLDIIGFERVSQLIPQNTLMTVDGFFRLYEGRIGCGKGAPIDSSWYLELYQIVQPNPLSRVVELAGTGLGSGLFPSLETEAELGTPTVTQTPSDGTGQPTTIPTATPVGTTPNLPPGTSTGTPPSTLPPTIIPTSTMQPSPTSESTATMTAIPTNTRAPGTTPVSTPTSGPFPTSPPLATATEGYPSQPTSEVYPGPGAAATGYP